MESKPINNQKEIFLFQTISCLCLSKIQRELVYFMLYENVAALPEDSALQHRRCAHGERAQEPEQNE